MLQVTTENEAFYNNQINILNKNVPFALALNCNYQGFRSNTIYEVIIFKVDGLKERLFKYSSSNNMAILSVLYYTFTHDIIITYGKYLCEKEQRRTYYSKGFDIVTTSLAKLLSKWHKVAHNYPCQILETFLDHFCYQNSTGETIKFDKLFSISTSFGKTPNEMEIIDLSKYPEHIPLVNIDAVNEYKRLNNRTYIKIDETLEQLLIPTVLLLVINDYIFYKF